MFQWEICPRLSRQEFEDLPLEHAILSFIRDLRHSRDIIYLTDVSVDYLHQPWRAFATIINKCLSGKETRIDKICLSRAQILWDEGTGTKPGVLNVPKYDSKSYKESWGDSDEEDDDEDDFEDDVDNNDDDSDNNDENEDERT
nr:hypothetical protein [Tanacetum cinerariifolium]